MTAEVEAVLAATMRDARAAVLASIARTTNGDLDMAEDGLADAIEQALRTWPRDGLPDRPAGWLVAVGRRRAIDRIRHDSRARVREQRTGWVTAALARPAHARDPQELLPPASDVALDRTAPLDQGDLLRLVFTCCHPALSQSAQVALTLRHVAGLTTREIARGFLVATPTMAQRLVRAKRKIVSAGIRFQVPRDSELPERLPAVLAVVHLVYNEAYVSASSPDLQRVDLADTAIRLARLLHDLMPDEAEVAGLLALLLLTDARSAARTDADGDLVVLAEQDRSMWNRAQVSEGVAFVESALRRGTIGPYQVMAAIAACHSEAPSVEATDWKQIVALYRQLVALVPSPAVRVNAAVAIARLHGPGAGLAALARVERQHDVDGWHLFHAAVGELRAEAGDVVGAVEALVRARGLATNPRERAHLDRRLDALASQAAPA